MSSRKSTSTEIIKAAETIGAAAVCVGAAILFITNPEVRGKIVKRLGGAAEVDKADAPKPAPSPPTPRTGAGTPVTGGDGKPSVDGVVYLLRAGPFYKIGKAQGFDRRYRQIKLQLPYPTEALHQIECGDINHVERYWHKRFAAKRQNGEWFVLTGADVDEFKAQSRM